MSMQAVVAASIVAPLRRAFRHSESLRRIYNRLRTDTDLMQTRHIPERAFSGALRHEYLELFRRAKRENLGDYLEFGVFNGTSLSCAHAVHDELSMDRLRCYGFDSFKGLPKEAAHEDEGVWFPGQFACRIDVAKKLLGKRDVDWDRVILIEGWFDDTLNAETIDQYGIKFASVVMIDCDLYSSAARCLDFVAPLLTNSSVLIFDDWHSHHLADSELGERKAFEEFMNKHPEFSAEHVQGYNEFSHIIRLERQTA